MPRQPGLNDAPGFVEMLPAFARAEAFDGLQGFSHVWLLFGFDRCGEQWKFRVRPPRLGGNQSLGVFASRSPYRPNNLGISVVQLLDIELTGERIGLQVSGLDLVDGTPVFDIKPYIAYADAVANAASGYAENAPKPRLTVAFSSLALQQIEVLPDALGLRVLIEQTLVWDPRPAYHQQAKSDRCYGVALGEWNVRWRVIEATALVEALEPIR